MFIAYAVDSLACESSYVMILEISHCYNRIESTTNYHLSASLHGIDYDWVTEKNKPQWKMIIRILRTPTNKSIEELIVERITMQHEE